MDFSIRSRNPPPFSGNAQKKTFFFREGFPKKEPPSFQLGCFSSIYSLGRCASHSIPFKVKYTFLIPCLLECPSLHLHISPMSFHPSWPTFRPRMRSKYLHRLSDTTLLHTCIQLPGGLKHSIEFLQH